MRPRSLAFLPIIGSGCDRGLRELGRDVIKACVNAAKEPAFPSLIGSGCDQGLRECSQGALRSPP